MRALAVVVTLALAACAPPAIQLVATVPIESPERSPLPEAAEVWVAMIDGARETLDLAEFYASNAPDSRLEPVVRAVEAALHRGVRVRVLAEHSFVHVYP